MINQERLVRLFLEMCRVNTPPRHEKALVDRIQPRLEALGFSCVRDHAHEKTGGNCGNLIASLKGSIAGASPIFFSAHFDTVEANPDVQIVFEDGLIKTDGSSILGADDKGGMAPIIEAMQSIIEDQIPHGDIQLLLTVSEEIGLLGAHHIDRSLIRAEFGFVLDTGPPVGSVVVSAPSQDSLTVTIKGRPAHAGIEPEKGISAIQVAARAIEKMNLGRIDGETTANVGVIQGGEATNIVCPEVRVRAEARSRDPGKLASQVKHMVDTFQVAGGDFAATVEVAVRHIYDTYRLTERDRVIRIAREAAESIGLASPIKEAGGGADANVFNALGIPTCVLGTGMRNIHTHDECISVEDMVKSAEWVVAIVKRASVNE
jgi:tripeptide aminopeptidase